MSGLERVDLNLLVPLNELLRTVSVTRAAQNLHLSQSAMSATLARCRHLLDDPLLVRVGREMALTPYAESLVVPVAELLVQAERVVTARPGFDPVHDERAFTVIASDYTTLTLLRPFLRQWADRAPAVRLQVQPLRDDYVDRLRADEVDLLLISEQFCAEELSEYPRRTMFGDEFVVCGWRGNEEVGAVHSVHDLAGMRFVQYVIGSRSNMADAALDELGVDRHVEIRTESQLLVPYLLTETPLIGLVPRRLATSAQAVADLHLVEGTEDLPPIREVGVWHPRRSADPAHRWLVEELCAVAGQLDADVDVDVDVDTPDVGSTEG